MNTRTWRWRIVRAAVSGLAVLGLIVPAVAETPAQKRPLEGCALTKSRLPANWLAQDPGEEATGLRELLTDTDVQSYFLDMEIFPATDSVSASCTISVVSLTNGLSEMSIRLRNNFTVSSVTCSGTPVSYTRPGGSITTMLITLDRAYNFGEAFDLVIAYSGQPVARGFGSFIFSSHAGNEIVSSLSEPWYCYTWWPAKEDNADKATIQLHFTVPDTYVVASNGALQAVTNETGNRLRYEWASMYPTAPYLVSVSATNYDRWTVTYNYPGGSMPVDFYIYPEYNNSSNRAAWEESVQMLATFRGVYGEYPFVDEKYGIYQFQFGGGMEHQTMTGQGTFSESVTAHELAHQWWGDMVTCETWNDIWLNEGFATYGEALWEEHKPGSSGLPALINAMNARRPSSVSDSVYVYDATDINRIFSYTYSYLKGAWALHQLRHVLGDANFFATLAAYRAAYEYDSATTDEFKMIAEGVYGDSLDWFFDHLVYGGGAPAYQWGWQNASVDGNDYLLVYVAQSQAAGYGVFVMPVDIRVTTGSGTQTHVIWNDAWTENFVIPIDSPATSVSLDPDYWILWTSRLMTGFVPGGPVVVATLPELGQALPATSTDQVHVTFHTDVSASAGDFAVAGDTTGPQSFSYSYNAATYTATLTFAGVLAPDTYTVTVDDAITASGNQLDGEIDDPRSPASLPSGDGLPGGAAVFEFVVRAPGPPGDLDLDGDVDLDDFAMFAECYNGSTRPPAVACPEGVDADLDNDGDVDLDDFAVFAANYTGSL